MKNWLNESKLEKGNQLGGYWDNPSLALYIGQEQNSEEVGLSAHIMIY